MVDTPKSSQTPPKQPTVDTSDIYFHAKTYDELQADREEAARVRKAHRPQYIPLRVTLLYTGLIGAVAMFVYLIPFIIIFFGPFGGVFLVFFFSLVLFGAVYVSLGYTSRLYDRWGVSSRLFFAMYLPVAILLFSSLYLLATQASWWTYFVSFCVVHAVFAWPIAGGGR